MNNSIHTTGANRLNPSGFITGLLIGGLAGFCIVILFTPQSGKKTRDQIGQKSIEIQNQAANTYDEFVILSRYNNHKILSGTRKESQSR